MNKKNIIIAVLGLLCSLQPAFSQNLSNKGREFWVGYGHHQFMESGQTNSQEMVLYLSAEQTANVTVTIDGTTWIRNYVVPANSVIVSDLIPKSGSVDARLISLPCTFVPPGTPCGGEGVFVNKGIHIVSNVPIVAYAHIYGSASSGATMLMPVETWGYSYVTLNSKQAYAANCFSWAYAIAKEDNTLIEVTPTQATRSGKPANVPFTVTLMKGQIYQLMAGPETGTNKPELSGTKVKSIANASGNCYPIAVFSGSSRTRGEPASCGAASGGDNDNQQCFPSQAWGKRYLTAPTSNSANPSTSMYNTYKIAIKDAGTQVWRNGALLTGLTNNYYEFISNEAEYITSDKPVMVAQFIHSGSACFGGGGVGDPEMMYISPIEQGIKRIGFYRNTQQGITVNYLTLIIPTGGVPSLRIDGSAAFSYTYPHPKLAGYTVVVKQWSAATTQAVAQSDSAFTAITYGLGSVESYGYNAGTLINNLNAVGSIFNSSDTSSVVTSHPFTCINTPVKLSVLLAYQPTRIVWQLSQVGAALTPNADVTDNAPVQVGPPVTISGVPYYKYSLPGNYSFSAAGTYTVPVLATHPSIENCTNTEQLGFNVEVRGNPIAGFSFTHSGCISDAVQFNGPATSANGYTLNQWVWTYPDATTSNTQNPTHTFPTAGNQSVNLHMVSTEGCVSDTIRTVPIYAKPTTVINATPLTTCEGGTITFSETTTYGGSGPVNNYYWNFGNGTATTVGPHAITYPNFGTYNVKHVAGVSAACVSDTATQVIRVYAKPTTTFTYPAGCLPASGTVQFTSTASVPDGQAITGYAWNFGDPGSGAANTSTLASPTHNYPTFGTYTITFSVTTANGCTKDTTVTATFNLSPTFSYPALSPVCQSVTGTVSVATASVTNGVPGTGVYHGPATTPAGLFSPSVAGAGTHTIWYVYSATSGCTDSVSQTITVNPKPAANFTIPSAGCLPTNGIVQFTYTGTPVASYLWNFGDPASGAANTSTLANPTHNYVSGSYTITLSVTTAQGCVDDTTMTTPFSVRPALNYPVLPAVCQSVAGTVSVATASVTNGVTGTGVYQGPGTNAAGNFSPSAAGAGTHTIWYVFTSSGNCTDSISRTITVNPKPNASFTYPTVCLPASGSAQFNYNGSAVTGYLWNFGDPASGGLNTSTAANPTHIYTNTGSYTITLTATNANGCTDDTTITTILSVTPALTYPALAPVCQSVAGTIPVNTATVTNGVAGTGVYSGPGTDAAGNFNPAAAGAGTHTITYTFTSTGNCVATATSTITVGAKPNASFTYTPATGCLPANGQVQFNYNGSGVSSYSWNFGDPASGGLNTSTVASPSHIYSNTGSHDIVLNVTGANGCTDDTTITRVFSVTPALSYPALAPVCQSVAGTVPVATATVTNGVSGTGVYSGPGTDAAGNFNPAIAGAGTHTITYTFTSTGNCIATTTTTITVGAKPNASFTYTPTTACLPATGQVQFNYNGSGVTAYSWNFGDPASGGLNTSTAASPSHIYSNTGSHDIVLNVTGANGCTDDTTITRTFSVTPALNYPVLPTVCESVAGPVSVATATVTNGVTGTGVYSGPGTDAAGNFNPAIAGAGTHTITYTFTSTGNCVATITRPITVNAKPNASFTFAPATACLPTTGQVQFTYNGTAAASYSWNFGDPASGGLNTSTAAGPSHIYSNTGSYDIVLNVIGANGCTDDTTITRTFSVTPALNYPALSAVCESAGTGSVATATVTNGVTGTGVYSGPGTDAAGNFNPALAGAGTHTITYTFTSTGNCVSTITRPITVNAKPNASFTYTPNTACLPTTGQVQFTYNGTAAGSYAWNFGDPASGGLNTATAANPAHIYTNTGNYNIVLNVTGTNGCTDDTTITRTFSVTPALNYPVLPTVCESAAGPVSVATATVTNGVTGTGVYSGPGTDAAGNFNPALAGAGTHTITYTFTSTGNCVATITRPITVNAKPNASFTYTPTATCLPTTGQVQFTYNGTAAGSYSWNFGDPASGALNTATAASPSHIYTNTGSYAIVLNVIGANGCTDDTTITRTFSVTPALTYAALNSVCESTTGTVSVATASVTNGVSGTGVYSGAGTDAAGNFTPSAAGAGTHTITYTFTSTGNCIATATATIIVDPKPTAVFVTNTNICLDQSALITDNSGVASGAIATWKWIFGDNTTTTNTNGTPFNHNYAAFGNYTVKLITTSDKGCVSDTARQDIGVHAVPVANFTMPLSVCMPNGSVTFQNASGVADNAAMTYQWDFGDATGSTAMNPPAHVYPPNSVAYDITLTATSSFGCVHDTIQTFSAFFNKPVADFQVSPTTVCEGTPHSFTIPSGGPGNTVTSQLWLFGDGTTSTALAPSKIYQHPGTYDVRLLIKTAQGCASDTSAAKTVVVHLQPVIDAGRSFTVLEGTIVQFEALSNSTFTYLWTWAPGEPVSDNGALNPILQVKADGKYKLTATGPGGCIASDELIVKVLRPVKVPNAFSPNGDQFNQKWQVDNLNDYPGATVQIFNRYGQLVYNSIGYAEPWDGTVKGKPLPVATYYYIIDLKNGFKPLNGSVTIIR